MSSTIQRQPIHLPTFSMPTKKEIESLHKGSIVKVKIGDSEGNNVERMWTIIQSIDEYGWVEATLDNTPFHLPLLEGEKIKFHVTDIICVN